jgi:hypothetical protein
MAGLLGSCWFEKIRSSIRATAQLREAASAPHVDAPTTGNASRLVVDNRKE